MGANDPISGVGVAIGKKPHPSADVVARTTTDSSGGFTFHIAEPGDYQVVILGGDGSKNLKPGTAMKLSVDLQSATPAASNARQAPPVTTTSTAVLDAKGSLTFPDGLHASEASTLTGRLAFAAMPSSAKELNPVLQKPVAAK